MPPEGHDVVNGRPRQRLLKGAHGGSSRNDGRINKKRSHASAIGHNITHHIVMADFLLAVVNRHSLLITLIYKEYALIQDKFYKKKYDDNKTFNCL